MKKKSPFVVEKTTKIDVNNNHCNILSISNKKDPISFKSFECYFFPKIPVNVFWNDPV